MIYCIQYPSGGFGHYINAVISLYGKNFCRPSNTLTFAPSGNSHSLETPVPTYFKEPDSYSFDFNPGLNYSVLIDNGVNNESKRFKQFFPDAITIKVGYSDWTWPILAKTMIVKSINSSLLREPRSFNTDINVSFPHWDTNEDWALREKYFLYLRDHTTRFKWKPDSDLFIDVSNVVDSTKLTENLTSAGIELDDFSDVHDNFLKGNYKYFIPTQQATHVMDNLNQSLELDITDIWTQAIVYYYIWLKYDFEVPHNDYSNWFTSTDDIVKMLVNHGVNIDSN